MVLLLMSNYSLQQQTKFANMQQNFVYHIIPGIWFSALLLKSKSSCLTAFKSSNKGTLSVVTDKENHREGTWIYTGTPRSSKKKNQQRKVKILRKDLRHRHRLITSHTFCFSSSISVTPKLSLRSKSSLQLTVLQLFFPGCFKGYSPVGTFV